MRLPTLIILSLAIPVYLFGNSSKLDSLLSNLEESKRLSSQTEAEQLLAISWEFRRKSADSTIHYARLAEQKALAAGHNILRANAVKNIGIGFDIKGMPDSAFHFMSLALELSKEIGSSDLIAKNLNNLGFAYHRQGFYEIALEYYYKSLSISEEIEDPLQGVTLMNIGLLEQRLENYEKAVIYYQRALEFAKKEGNSTRITSCLYNLGGLQTKQKNYKQALDIFASVIDLAKQNNDILLLGKTTNSIARVHKKQGSLSKAEAGFKKGVEYAEQSGDRETQVQGLLELSLLNYEQKRFQTALQYAEKGLDYAKLSNNRESEKSLLQVSADCHEAMGNYRKALDFQKQFLVLSDKIFNKAQAKKIRSLEIKKKIEDKEKDIALLQLQKSQQEALINKQQFKISTYLLGFLLLLSVSVFLFSLMRVIRGRNRKLQVIVDERTLSLKNLNRELKTKNEELERFTFITSHDLKEPLRNISGFTKLLGRRLNQHLDEESKTYVSFIQNSTKQMHNLLEDVLKYSAIGKIQENQVVVNTQKTALKVKAAIEENREFSRGKVLIESLPIIKTVPENLYIILKNLTENGLRFNESPNPMVEISCYKTEDSYVFNVTDNGIGVPEEYHGEIFKMFKRLHNRKSYPGSGLGLALVKKLSENMGGQISIEDRPGGGSIFRLSLPALDMQEKVKVALSQGLAN